MTRTLSHALLSAALATSAAVALPQLPGAKFPPPKNAPPVFVPKSKTDRPKPPAKPKPVWQEFPLPKATLMLDLTEASPDAVLGLFSRTSGITILRDPTFKVPLTITSGKAVPLNEAFEILDTVLSLNGYSLQKRGNLLVVARPQPQAQPQTGPPPPPPPQPEIKTYPVLNANAAQVARVLNEILGAAAAAPAGGGGEVQFNPGFQRFGGVPGAAPGGAGGASKFKASSEDYSNSVVVYALPPDQAKAEALIKSLDTKTATPLESEVFKLQYVPAEEAVSAIEDVLTANSPVGRGAKKADNNQNGGFYSYYDRFSSQNQHTAGGQSATSVKATNSVIVNATKENLELIRKLLKNLDQQATTVGTTFTIRLDNAKATDVADLLTKLFTAKQNNNDGFFFFDYYGGGNNKKGQSDVDTDENGQIVNVRDIQGKVTVVADPNTNSLVIQTQPGNMRSIRPIIEKLDSPVTQVMIETLIVEANLTKTDKLGVEYGTLGSIINGSGNGDQGSGSIDLGVASATDIQGLKYTIGNPDYKIFLNAVQKDERFKVLDTPRVFTSNNAKAIINVGQRVPYITNTNVGPLGNVVNSYNFLDVAVNLTVTPRITASGQVTMDVVQTADDVQGFTTYNAPIVNNRSATTTVSVTDGETIVLGGIIRHTTTNSVTKVPILGDLPVLGQLFRSSSRQNGQTELMVFLTPHVVRSNADAQRLRKEQTNELTKPSQDDLRKFTPPPTKSGKGP